jgi:hypothetical protein
MPRFFFNHRSNQGEYELDLEGIKLPSVHDALDEATFAAQGAASLADRPVSGEFEIEDEGRVLIARVPYTIYDAGDGAAVSADSEMPQPDGDAALPDK